MIILLAGIEEGLIGSCMCRTSRAMMTEGSKYPQQSADKKVFWMSPSCPRRRRLRRRPPPSRPPAAARLAAVGAPVADAAVASSAATTRATSSRQGPAR